MRTSIEKTVTTSVHSNGKTYKDVTTTKRPYVTIGDIIGTSKSAYAAVSALKKAKGNSSIAKTAAAALIDPLIALLTSMSVYKKIMSVVGKVTPIVKLIARASGIMHSPGNSSDIAEIIFGELQKILVYLAVTAVVELKEFIWNLEIPLVQIDSTASEPITEAIEENGKKLSSTVVNIITSLESMTDDSSSDASDYSNSYVEELEEMQEEESELAGIVAGTNTTDGKAVTYKFSDIKTTDKEIAGTSYKRLIAGSSEDKGLFYSDDNGTTWIQSNVTSGNYVTIEGEKEDYCSGSGPVLKATSDSSFSKEYYKLENVLYRFDYPLKEGLYELSNSSYFEESKTYYTADSSMKLSEASPSSLGLYNYDKTLSSDGSFSSSGIYYILKDGTYSTATPSNLGLYCESSDESFAGDKKYYTESSLVLTQASPASLGLYEIEKDGNGIKYTDDYGTTWSDSNKTTGDCYKIKLFGASGDYPATLVMLSSSNEGIWYSTNYSEWKESDTTSGCFYEAIEDSSDTYVPEESDAE